MVDHRDRRKSLHTHAGWTLRAILHQEGLDDANEYERRGALRHGLCCCPFARDLFDTPSFTIQSHLPEKAALVKRGVQIEGATRSTIVNLFHLSPLVYHSLTHVPETLAWGHAICNTRLGQRRCYSPAELISMDRKVGIIREEGVETFGWISDDWQMIRSPNGAVWIQLNGDGEEGPPDESGFSTPSEKLPESRNGRVDASKPLHRIRRRTSCACLV